MPTVLTDPSGALAGQECGEEEWCGGLVQIPPDFFEPKGEVTGAGGGFTGEGTLPPAPEIISTEPTVNIQPVIDQSTQQSNQGLGYTQTDRINNLQNGIASHTSLMQDTLQQYSDEVANSSPGQERIIGESGHIRIPDLTNMGGLKSGNVIRYSGNLKDFIAYARGTGEPVRLYVRPWADISAIQEYIDAGYVEVYYVRPLSAVVV